MEEPLNSCSGRSWTAFWRVSVPPTVPTHCRRRRPGIAPDESGFDPTAPPSEPSLPRRSAARPPGSSLERCCSPDADGRLLGRCWCRRATARWYGQPHPPGDLRRLTGSGVEFVTDAAPTPKAQAQLCCVSGPAGALPAAGGCAHRPAPAGRAAPAGLAVTQTAKKDRLPGTGPF